MENRTITIKSRVAKEMTAKKKQNKISISVTIDPVSYKRAKKLVDAGKRENVSRIVDECLSGYLHVIETNCGTQFIPAENRRSYTEAIIAMLKAVTDADLLGETLALCYNKKLVQEQIKKLGEFCQERYGEDDEEESEEEEKTESR
ncbi:MAG: hypothetical protein IJ387_05780 [Thermoguttaceae bacterium]|nr:hypothetical protein [Thermoguttaceae bacterium]